MREIPRAGRGVFGIAVLCALGFGAAEALAGPASSAPSYLCKPRVCIEDCIAMGAQGGSCNYMDDSCNCTW